jgi:hypothetical protein
MPAKRELVYWHDKHIGYFELINVDMFNIYGKFFPLHTVDSDNFLAATQDESSEIHLQIGNTLLEFIEFWADEPEMIELKFHPTWSNK